MALTEIGLLQDNLVDLYYCLTHHKNGRELPLRVVYQNRICHKYSITAIVNLFLSDEQPPEWVQNAIQFTLQDLFRKCVVEHSLVAYQKRVVNWIKCVNKRREVPHTKETLRPSYEAYLKKTFGESSACQLPLDHFDQAFDKKPLDGDQVDRLRVLVTATSQATRGFWTAVLTPPKEGFLEPVNQYLPSSILNNQTLYSALYRAQCIVDLEGRLKRKIPLGDLIRLSDSKRVQKWIRALNRKYEEIPFLDFQKALQEIVRIAKILGYQLTLDDLILHLHKLDCDILCEEDPVHMQWRENLKEGSIIQCNGKDLTLGKELGNKAVLDCNRVFELTGDLSQFVVIIALNRFLLPIRAHKMEKDQWGVQGAPIFQLDKKGRCLLMEKLPHAVVNYPWGDNVKLLKPEDHDKGLVLANHVFCFHQWGFIPKRICPEYLFFADNVLKSVHILEKEAFHYNNLERFCYDLGRHNVVITDFVMHVSKLIEHPVAKFYREAVEYVIINETTDLMQLKQPEGFKGPEYRFPAEQICKQASEILGNSYVIIRDLLRRKGAHNHKQDKDLLKRVKDRFLKYYRGSSTPGIIAGNLQERLIKSFVDNREEEFPILDPATQEYYRQSYERMMAYNHAISNKKITG